MFGDYARSVSETRVVDGDTVVVAGERIRLRSEAGPIDAPELAKAKCPLELFRAEAARDRLAAIIARGARVVDTGERDRWRRPIVLVYVDGKDVGAQLVAEGHAKLWPKIGGKMRRENRPEWCGG
ncbi:thermonuclease family protein [Hansschlegelia beijingensis]|uniref:thermonuclease family protein n=1 Tax=Hansschlegelia beijingensis TaxID=1133344 RepID=UPI00387F099C